MVFPLSVVVTVVVSVTAGASSVVVVATDSVVVCVVACDVVVVVVVASPFGVQPTDKVSAHNNAVSERAGCFMRFSPFLNIVQAL